MGTFKHTASYPPDIRKAIYTTNTIEPLNSVIRKATKKCKTLPTDEPALQVAHPPINKASEKWTIPIGNWKPTLSHFMIDFEDLLKDYT